MLSHAHVPHVIFIEPVGPAQHETMSAYKLYYFDARDGVDASRIILAHAGVKYEDICLEDEQWTKEYKEAGKLVDVSIEDFEGASF